MKRPWLLVLVMLCAGALLIQYWQGVQSDLELLARSDPAAACIKGRSLFRILTAAALLGMASASAYLTYLGRRLLKGFPAGGQTPGRFKGAAAVFTGMFFLILAGVFAWCAVGVDRMLDCGSIAPGPAERAAATAGGRARVRAVTASQPKVKSYADGLGRSS